MNEKTNEPAPGKYGSIIREARKPENQKAGLPVSDHSPEQAPKQAVEMVNLSIKVDKKLRSHWAAEAKRDQTTLVAAITEALLARFGAPE